MAGPVAELTLNAEKFAASTKTAMGSLGPAAAKAGEEAAKKFDSALVPGLRSAERKFQEVVKRAVSASGGGEILNLDLPGLRASAVETEKKAAAARTLATALERVNGSTQKLTVSQQVELQAAQAIARKFEDQARAAREEIIALEALQAELGQTGQVQQVVAQQSAAQKAGLQQVGFQMQDFVVQIAGGTSVMRAFSMQAPQMFSALALMAGEGERATSKFGKFAQMMGGPVGIALGVAIPLFAIAAEKLFGLGDAADEAKEASKRLGDGINFQKMSVDQLVKSIGELEAAQRQQIRSSYDSERATLADAKAALKAAADKREEAIATLERAKAAHASSIQFGGLGAGAQGVAFQKTIVSLDAMIARLTTAQGEAQNLVRLTQIPIEKRQAEARTDPRKGIENRFEQQAGLLDRSFAAGTVTAAAYRAQMNVLTAARDRDIESLNKQTKGQTSSNQLMERGEDAAKKIASIADRFSDLREGMSESQRALRELDDLANDFALKKPPNYEALLRQIEKAREIVSQAPERRAQAAIDKELESLRDVAEIEATRARIGEVAAAKLEAHLRIVRQFPEATAAQLAPLQRVAEAEAARLARAKELATEQDKLKEIGDRLLTGVDKDLEDQKRRMRELATSFETAMNGGIRGIWDMFAKMGREKIAEIAAQLATSIKIPGLSSERLKVLAGSAGTGVAAAQLTGGSRVGGAIGGILGQEGGDALGKAMSKGAEKGLGKLLGGIAGPLGSVIGGVLGGLLGGMFTKASRASIVVNSTNGDISARGNNAEAIQSVTGAGTQLQAALNRIIDQLGGIAGNFSVAIGTYKDSYRVSGSGLIDPSIKHFPEMYPGDSIYAGNDANEALRAAILNAIQDGAVQGIRDGTKRLLAAGKDLDANLSKALRFEQAFKDLKALTDPLGAAIDEVNLKFRQLRDIAVEAGASTDEMAQLQDLYRRELDAAKKSSAGAAEGLRDFLQSLKVGTSSPLALRDQQISASAALKPFEELINGGKAVDKDAFQKAAQSSLDVARQLYGSSQAYFDQYDLVKSLTEKAIAQIDAQAAKSAEEKDPFASLIAQSTQASANILEQQSGVLAEQTAYLRQMAEWMGMNRNSFLNDPRGYV